MNSLPDVNVLFPLLCGDHQHHPIAWEWWQVQPDGTVGLCWPAKLGVLRLLTNAKVMGGKPLKPDQALAAWDALSGDPRTFWIDGTPPGHAAHLARLVQGRAPAPNLWSDAWLAALAESCEMRMTTFDQGFRSFHLGHARILGPRPTGTTS